MERGESQWPTDYMEEPCIHKYVGNLRLSSLESGRQTSGGIGKLEIYPSQKILGWRTPGREIMFSLASDKFCCNFQQLMCSHDARGKMGDAMEQCEVSDLFVESRVRGVGTENFPN